MRAKDIADDLLRRARNLNRYPFQSATMAEAGKLAADHLMRVAHAILTDPMTIDEKEHGTNEAP
jgi:hypothetical protein